MSVRNSTKHLLEQTLEDMLNEMPLSKVRVNELCKRAGVAQRVFYYHFKDKYDLAAWIFLYDLYDTTLLHSTRDTWSRSLVRRSMVAQMNRYWERRDLYQKLFLDDSQYSLREYVMKYNVETMERQVKIGAGLTELNDEAKVVVRFAAHGCMGATIDWLCGTIDSSPDAMGDLIYELVTQTVLSISKRSTEFEGMLD